MSVVNDWFKFDYWLDICLLLWTDLSLTIG